MSAPAASRGKNKNHTSVVTAGTRRVHPAFPHANGFNGFLRALLGDRAFLPPSQATMRKHRRQLDASVGASGPHDFAVRALHCSSSQAARVHRIPRPTSVTIAKRPSVQGRGTARLMDLIWANREAIYFCAKGWTGSISLIGFEKFAVWRKAIECNLFSSVIPRSCASIRLEIPVSMLCIERVSQRRNVLSSAISGLC